MRSSRVGCCAVVESGPNDRLTACRFLHSRPIDRVRREAGIAILHVMSNHNPIRKNRKPHISKLKKQSGLLGIGLDNHDGHDRVTRGDDFLLLGGSEETHERMQDLVIRVEERLKRKGKRISDLQREEFEDTVRDSLE